MLILKFILYWAAKNKLMIQDDSKIYTLGLNEQKDELVFLIGGPNSVLLSSKMVLLQMLLLH